MSQFTGINQTRSDIWLVASRPLADAGHGRRPGAHRRAALRHGASTFADTVTTDHAGSHGAADAAHAATVRERAAALRRRAAGVRGRRAGSCTEEAVAVAVAGPAAAVALSIKRTTAAVALPFKRETPRPRPEAPLSLRRLRREASETAEVWRRLGLVVGVVERRLTCGCFIHTSGQLRCL